MSDDTKSEKASVLLWLSTEFKEAIGIYATSHNSDMVKIIRVAIANYIGYTLTDKDLPTNGRTKIYQTKKEKLKATRDKRLLEKVLLEMYNHNEHVRSVVAIQQSLEKKGIDTD